MQAKLLDHRPLAAMRLPRPGVLVELDPERARAGEVRRHLPRLLHLLPGVVLPHQCRLLPRRLVGQAVGGLTAVLEPIEADELAEVVPARAVLVLRWTRR